MTFEKNIFTFKVDLSDKKYKYLNCIILFGRIYLMWCELKWMGFRQY